METARSAAGSWMPRSTTSSRRLVGELEPLQREYNEPLWMASVDRRVAHAQESATSRRADPEDLRASRALPAWLVALEDRGGASDPLLERQPSSLLQPVPAPSRSRPRPSSGMVRLEKSLESRFNNFRAELDGERVTDNAAPSRCCGTRDDSARRRRAWEAAKQVGRRGRGRTCSTLVRLRNRSARGCSASPNYYCDDARARRAGRARAVRAARRARARHAPAVRGVQAASSTRGSAGASASRPRTLRPWHYSDPFFQEAPAAEVEPRSVVRGPIAGRELTERFFAPIGFDIADLLARADLYEKPGKSQHAFCMLGGPRRRTSACCATCSPTSTGWARCSTSSATRSTTRQVDRALPYLLRAPAHILTTEASARCCSDGCPRTPPGSRATPALPTRRSARRAAAALARSTRPQLLVQTRW